MLALETVAEITYEANRIYRRSLGEPETPPWNERSDDFKLSLCRVVLDCYRHPNRTLREAHETWLKIMKDHGWRYGETEDYDLRTSPGMVSWENVEESLRTEDKLLVHMSKLLWVEYENK